MQVKAVLFQRHGHGTNCSKDISLPVNVVVPGGAWLCSACAFVQAVPKQASEILCLTEDECLLLLPANTVLLNDIWKQYRAVFGQIFPACSGYAVRCPLFPEV